MRQKERKPIAFRVVKATGETIGITPVGYDLHVYRTQNTPLDHHREWLNENTREATKEEYQPMFTALQQVFSDNVLYVVKHIPILHNKPVTYP